LSFRAAGLTLFFVKKNEGKSGLFQRPGNLFGGKLHAEKARLEAFLNAVPGAYCGWGADHVIAYNQSFCTLLGLQNIQTIHDIQNALSPGDAAAMEGLYNRLVQTGEPFSLTVQKSDKSKTFKLSGTRGQDIAQSQQFDILWLEDITDTRIRQTLLESTRLEAEAERDMLQAALDHLPMPLWMRNDRTEIIWSNRAYSLLVESTPATIIAEQREISLKSKSPGGRALAQQARDSGKPEILQGHVISGGIRHLMKIHEIPLSSSGRTLGFARDISREEDLKAESKRFQNANNELLEHLGSAIGIFGNDQKLEFYNSAFSQLWHLDEAYLNTRPKLGDMMEKLRESRRLPEQVDFRKFKQSWLGMFTGLIVPHDEMLYLPDDSALRMLVIPNPAGGLMMTFEDVTSHLELESSYNTLIAVQKETLDNLAEGVSVYGGDGRLKLWNPSFARLWNFNPEALEGEPHISRLAEKIKARFDDENWEKSKDSILRQSLDRNIHEGHMQCSDGSLIAYSTVPLPDGGVLVTHVDITDKMKVENALREKNIALETAERVKLDFLANVSYQLRTPLNALMGFTEILDNEYFGKLNSKQKEYTQGMQESGERLLSLINNILDLSTIEAGYMELQHDKVFINEIFQDLYELTHEWARRERLTITLECPKNIGAIIADKRRLKQILLNLVRNAITFTPENGTITLKAKRFKDRMEIIVSDTGTGIAREDQARIFEPFERIHGNGQGHGGAGLGLTLVKNIVELHQGTVTLKSMAGTGTAVTITLPLEISET